MMTFEKSEKYQAAKKALAGRPFDPPDSGKIAVKVISHYGDEVLKVYEV